MTHPVGQIIKDRLKSLKKTQGWLAEQANVSDTAVSKWIASGKISRESAKDVSRILGVSLDTLLRAASDIVSDELPSLSLIYVDADELRLLTAYRESNPMGKALIFAAADGAPRNESLAIVSIRHKP
jgi:transcriptional regulator with XRE-family HTH domain